MYAWKWRGVVIATTLIFSWCPAHKGISGNDVADGWAKQAASKPDDHGVEWLAYANGVRRPLAANLPSAPEA